MNYSTRIQKKILSYSYLCKSIGVISEEEYKKITNKANTNVQNSSSK